MLRWLWRLQSDRGGQHAEAGVLMATLIVLAGAVTVGSVPQLSTAISDQWVCHISDRGNQRCGGTTADGEGPAGGGFTAKTFGSTTTATTAGYTDPADSHYPAKTIDGNQQVNVEGYPTDVRFCLRVLDPPLCVAENGWLMECKDTGEPDPKLRYSTLLDCSLSITDETGLICTDEGLSPTWDTCLDAYGGVHHCTNPDAEDTRACRSADHDADTSPALLDSCGKYLDLRKGDAVCLGDNGTLYSCPDVLTARSDTPCDDGTRDIDPKALEECVPIVSHSSGTTVKNLSSSRVERCTYVPSHCDVEPRVPGTNYSCEPVSVRCLVQLPGDTDSRTTSGKVTRKTYQHCQSLGEIVSDGQSQQTQCVDGPGPGACDAAVTVTATSAKPPKDAVATKVGRLDLSIDPREEFDVTLDGKKSSKTIAELTDYCAKNVAACDEQIDTQVDAGLAAITDAFRQAGICSDDCDAFLGRLAGIGPGGTGRGLLSDGTDLSLGLFSDAVFLTGSIYNIATGNYATGALFAAGTVASVLRNIRNYRLRNVGSPAQLAGLVATGASITRGLASGLAAAVEQISALTENAESRGAAQDMLLRAMEEGRGAGGGGGGVAGQALPN